jgi:long-subunit fatty acid transport protein
MKLRQLVIGGGLVLATSAHAGGLFVPGSGVISASRAGAAVASVDDGEALAVNPSALAKADSGLQLTVSLTFMRYYMSFTRRGAYDPINLEDRPYEGATYQTVENDPKPPLGIGTYQPLPVISISYPIRAVKGLVIGGGLLTPTGYPFRDMSQGYQFQTDAAADFSPTPPPTRYDVMIQESALLLPSIAAAYRVNRNFDLGARFTAGNLKSKTQVVVWGQPNNVAEDVKLDSLFTAEVADPFIPAFALGATYRVSKNIELGANWTSPIVVRAKGTASSARGPSLDPSRVISAVPDAMAKCEKGGTAAAQKACISLELPMTATVGARYKILDAEDDFLADVEVNVNWENWGKRCDFDSGSIKDSTCTSPGQFRVQVDSGLYNTAGTFDRPLEVNAVNMNLRDTISLRLGAGYNLLNLITFRGGLAYDTAAAKEGWLRANFDGADRITATGGFAYWTPNGWKINAGFGYVHEGTNTNSGASADGSDCNPTEAGLGTMPGCGAGGAVRPPADRHGPDPTNPLIQPDVQAENPYNQGSIKSKYVMFMLGFTKNW